MSRVSELLARAPLFAALPPKVLAALAERSTRRRVRKGQRVLGRDEANLVVLVTGRLDVVESRAGEAKVVRSLLPPAVAGVSVAAGAKASAELWASQDGEVITVPGDAVLRALSKSPEAALAAIVHLGGVIAELSSELSVQRQHGLVERVRQKLLQLGAGRRELSITHARLAEEIGGSRANVSRALKRLERQGVVKRQRGRILL